MSQGPNITRIASAIGDPARAEMLMALMSGRAFTATELANHAGITKQTGSTHLRRLLDARLVAMHAQGRHRYFAIASEDVAQLLERMTGVAASTNALALTTGPRDPALRKARVCYDHLAGELAVSLYDALVRQGAFRSDGNDLSLSDGGERQMRAFGVDIDTLQSQRRVMCRSCMDWSERRPHLAGSLAAALLDRVIERGWAKRDRGSRLLVFRPSGERSLIQAFRLDR